MGKDPTGELVEIETFCWLSPINEEKLRPSRSLKLGNPWVNPGLLTLQPRLVGDLIGEWEEYDVMKNIIPQTCPLIELARPDQ
jgi:hypothetical protein